MHTEEAPKADKSLDFYDIGIAEIVLMPAGQYTSMDYKSRASVADYYGSTVYRVIR
ncbi:hypothetical protein [uncultured Bacteroides sp.]|uniref:hypothetical protein n=1 Tax=uncultured Bacteroides sp. TaxID=162156 RepID=UPI0025A9E4DC|nr:hypothetical protein [uncultured Bacteroides sp.]